MLEESKDLRIVGYARVSTVEQARHGESLETQKQRIRRFLDRPGVSLVDMAWDDAKRILSGTVRLVGGHASTLVFHVPDGYKLASADADGADDVKTKTHDDGTVTSTLRGAKSGVAKWRVAFR